MGKLLSVSVAAYNVERYLPETLETCMVDNAGGLEVIVVNDGSSDGTLALAQQFARRLPGVYKIIDKPNGGYGSTINASLDVATGRYFRYLDGDDWFDIDALSEYLDLLKGCNEDVVFTPYSRVYEDGSPTELIDNLDALTEGAYEVAQLPCDKNVAACSLAYRTALLKEIGFKMTENCFYADVEYACLPFAHAKTVRVSKLPLYLYRIGREGQSVSISGIEKHYKDIIRVCARILNDIGAGCAVSSKYLRQCVARECLAPYGFITMIPPTSERKKELMEFDGLVKGYPEVYEATGKMSKKVRLLRGTSFLVYGVLCRLSGK